MTHTMPWSESSAYLHDEAEASEDLDNFIECKDNSVNEIHNDNHEKDTEMDHYHSKNMLHATNVTIPRGVHLKYSVRFEMQIKVLVTID